MDLFEKINRAFGGWYEGLFGGSDDVRPKDVLHKILSALEEHRKEGFDNKVYVPNQYILEIAVDDEEEKEYLLSFLDRDDLDAAVRRYCGQNHYNIRGPLDFTIKEVETSAEGPKREKVRVRCKYAARQADAPQSSQPSSVEAPAEPLSPVAEENPTVYEVGVLTDSDNYTVPAVASAHVTINAPGKPAYDVSVARGALTIGRSRHAGNDVVLAEDGMVSRRHARIELDADGRFTLYDLDTTNGTRVNGKRIDNSALADGDEIYIGETRIVFHQDSAPEIPGFTRVNRTNVERGATARIVVMDAGRDIDDFVLGGETVIGRGVTNDIVLPDRSVATRHALIRRGAPTMLEVLDADATTSVNGVPASMGVPTAIGNGDRITLGAITLRFEEEGV